MLQRGSNNQTAQEWWVNISFTYLPIGLHPNSYNGCLFCVQFFELGHNKEPGAQWLSQLLHLIGPGFKCELGPRFAWWPLRLRPMWLPWINLVADSDKNILDCLPAGLEPDSSYAVAQLLFFLRWCSSGLSNSASFCQTSWIQSWGSNGGRKA